MRSDPPATPPAQVASTGPADAGRPHFPGCTIGPGPLQCASLRDGGPPVECFGSTTEPRLLVYCTPGRGSTEPTELGAFGCMSAGPRILAVPQGEAMRFLTTRAELAAYLGVDSPASARAYARIALGQDWHDAVFGELGKASGAGPWRVELFHAPLCGCHHPLARVELEVARDGGIRELGRTELGTTMGSSCVD